MLNMRKCAVASAMVMIFLAPLVAQAEDFNAHLAGLSGKIRVQQASGIVAAYDGMALASNDRIIVGQGAAVQVAYAGCTVNLGQTTLYEVSATPPCVDGPVSYVSGVFVSPVAVSQRYLLLKGQATEMDGTLANANAAAQQARNQKDLVKLQCLQGKVMAMKATRDALGQSLLTVEMADKLGNLDLVNHEEAKSAVLIEKMRELNAEVGQCVGEETFNDTTEVKVDEPADSPPAVDPLVVGGVAAVAVAGGVAALVLTKEEQNSVSAAPL